jgi:hypothetical protein
MKVAADWTYSTFPSNELGKVWSRLFKKNKNTHTKNPSPLMAEYSGYVFSVFHFPH